MQALGRLAPAVAAGLWLLAAGCGSPRSDSVGAVASPNVLIVTVDTLRADQIGAYGGPALTPNIDRLAESGLRFEHAVASVPSTRASHFSIFSGLHPRQHGVLSNADPLSASILTLPVVLAEAGYTTSGFTGVKLLAPGSGAERGFEVFGAPESGHRTARVVVDEAISWLETVLSDSSSQPWFQWVHVYDPHMPYGPPGDRGEVPAFLPAGTRSFSRPLVRTLLEETAGDLPSQVLDYALNQYRDEVEYVDLQLGRLLGTLQEANALEQTLIVFTADHGECFEAGYYFEHGGCLRESAVRVPLVVRFPGGGGAGTSLAQVELSQIAATVLEFTGTRRPDSIPSGGLLDEERPVVFVQRPLYSEKARSRRVNRVPEMLSVVGDPVRSDHARFLVGIRTPEWKLLLGGEEPVLYSLGSDPDETENLARQRPEIVELLRRELAKWDSLNPLRPSESTIDLDNEEILRNLGYLR